MRILAFDTSTFVGSVAVVADGRVLAEADEGVQARYGEVLLGHLERTLAAARVSIADVDLVAVGLGPGSFTGLRVGLATAKGLALARGTAIRGVPSLSALARGAAAGHAPGTLVASVTDARRDEVFAALHSVRDDGGVAELAAAMVGAPATIAAQLAALVADRGPRRVVVVGDGFRLYAAEMTPLLPPCTVADASLDTPRARALALEATELLAREGPSDHAALEPLYVRPSDAVPHAG